MKFLERRIPDAKNESPNSLTLDFILGLFGLICSVQFNYAVRTGIMDERFIYLNAVPIIGVPFIYLILRFSSLKIIKQSRLLYSGIVLQIGWAAGIQFVDFFI